MTSRLRSHQKRTELTVTALSRENKQGGDRIMELESRLRYSTSTFAYFTTCFLHFRTHLEERESAEQRSEASHKRLLSLLQVASAALSIEERLEPQDGPEKLNAKLGELVKVRR